VARGKEPRGSSLDLIARWLIDRTARGVAHAPTGGEIGKEKNSLYLSCKTGCL
jgi:hypothetical protein